jgi:hypothetical protein
MGADAMTKRKQPPPEVERWSFTTTEYRIAISALGTVCAALIWWFGSGFVEGQAEISQQLDALPTVQSDVSNMRDDLARLDAGLKAEALRLQGIIAGQEDRLSRTNERLVSTDGRLTRVETLIETLKK